MTHAMSDAAENKNLSSTERSRKFMNVTVYFLDDASHVFQLQVSILFNIFKFMKKVRSFSKDYLIYFV